jgi:predicted HTH transcriptional regulator
MSGKLLELVKKGESEEVEFKNKRVGTENIIISPEELERIILEKRRVYWDSQIYKEVSFWDIDEEKVRWFVNKAKTERNLKIDEKFSVSKLLERLELFD